MPSKEWSPIIDSKEYSILVEHGAILRRYKIYLNGHVVKPLDNIITDKGNRLSFKIDNHMLTLIIKSTGIAQFDYDLVIDGISAQTSTKVELPPELVLKKKGCLAEIKDAILGAIIFGLLNFAWGLSERFYDSIGKYRIFIMILLFAIIVFLFRKRLFKRK